MAALLSLTVIGAQLACILLVNLYSHPSYYVHGSDHVDAWFGDLGVDTLAGIRANFMDASLVVLLLSLAGSVWVLHRNRWNTMETANSGLALVLVGLLLVVAAFRSAYCDPDPVYNAFVFPSGNQGERVFPDGRLGWILAGVVPLLVLAFGFLSGRISTRCWHPFVRFLARLALVALAGLTTAHVTPPVSHVDEMWYDMAAWPSLFRGNLILCATALIAALVAACLTPRKGMALTANGCDPV